MPLRETMLNLAITAVLVLIVVLGGLLLREHRAPGSATAAKKLAAVVPNEAAPREMTPLFQVFPRAELVDSRANEADTLRLRLGDEEHIFVLYFADALEATMNHPQVVADQGRYFGNANDQVITEMGQEAAAWVAHLLKTRPFRLLTRWERVENTTRYYALVLVELEPGQPVYLADLLVRHGYARTGSVTTELPGDPRDESTYALELQALAAKARQERVGIWSRVAAVAAPLPGVPAAVPVSVPGSTPTSTSAR